MAELTWESIAFGPESQGWILAPGIPPATHAWQGSKGPLREHPRTPAQLPGKAVPLLNS